MSDEALQRVARFLQGAARVAVLTGAGVSAESGLATFRGPDGLWEGERVEDVATPRGFARDPARVWRFYNLRRANLTAAQPNPGHRALAELERGWSPGGFTLITQNVDGLHRAAGSRNVLEVHGSLHRVRCSQCNYQTEGLDPLPELPACACGALLRPDVVWFEEALDPHVWRQAERAAEACACFLVIGTSAIVYPAAHLVPIAREAGAVVVEINLTRTPASHLVDVGLYGKSGEVLPALVALWDRPPET